MLPVPAASSVGRTPQRAILAILPFRETPEVAGENGCHFQRSHGPCGIPASHKRKCPSVGIELPRSPLKVHEFPEDSGRLTPSLAAVALSLCWGSRAR
jgi:hypothetical protein